MTAKCRVYGSSHGPMRYPSSHKNPKLESTRFISVTYVIKLSNDIRKAMAQQNRGI
jgi:hypothetical protein